jgi:GIY-YIG catalytic domain
MSTDRKTAQRILDTLAFMPFEECQSLSRQFDNIPARPGLYAVRHNHEGLLYIGKSKSLRGRFSGGHKAFLWAWLDEDVVSLFAPSPLGKTLRYY